MQVIVWFLARCEPVAKRGCFFFQAEDGIRDLVRSRGLGDVYKRQEFPDVCAYLHSRNPCQHMHNSLPGKAYEYIWQNLSLIHI